MRLIRAILKEPWMVEPGTLEAWLPLALQIIQGEEVQFFEENQQLEPYAVGLSSRTRYRNYSDAPEGSVAVHPIIGPITKYDGWCHHGTETMMRNLALADRQSNIVGHLLEIDSGGGQATNIETVARFIRSDIQKPVVAWFNGLSASAAYYIATSADEIYAGQTTDLAGSIGCMITFADFRQFYADNGIKIHEVYADQSKRKNLDFREALDGKYGLLKTDILNPHAQQFIDTVKEFRPGISNEEVFQGGVYPAPKAIDLGMIDGILTFQAAVDRVAELAQVSNSSTKPSTNMQRLESVLGYALEMQDGGAFLRRDELAKLERRLVVEGETPIADDDLASINQRLDSLEQGQTEMQQTINSQQEQITSLEQEVQVLGDRPGDGPTKVATEADPEDSQKEPDALDKLEALASSDEQVYFE